MDSTVVEKKKRKYRFNFDYTLLFAIVLLNLFGLVMLYSVSSYEASIKFQGDATHYLRTQAIALGIGFVGMLLCATINYHVWEKLIVPLWFVSLGMLFMVLSSWGYSAGGAKRWFRPFNNDLFSVQPAEIAKVALILVFAELVVKMGDRVRTLKGLVLLLGLALPHTLVILFVTDNLSSAIIVMGIVVLLAFVATPNYKEYIIFLVAVIAIAALYVFLIKTDVLDASAHYRYARVKTWLNPEAYAGDDGYQTLQALYAIGSGGLTGKGLGESMQKLGYVPEAQNDMIFAIICEELGLFGAFAVILLFILIIWRLFIIANNAADMYGALVAVGVMAHISLQVIFNIAVVTNTIPNTGITLPFISYGGSSVLFLMAEMGIVLNISKFSRTEDGD